MEKGKCVRLKKKKKKNYEQAGTKTADLMKIPASGKQRMNALGKGGQRGGELSLGVLQQDPVKQKGLLGGGNASETHFGGWGFVFFGEERYGSGGGGKKRGEEPKGSKG